MRKTVLSDQAVELEWGPVRVTRGVNVGRIGYFDDTEGAKGIVYFGHPLYSSDYYLIPLKSLAPVTTHALITRDEALFRLIGVPHEGRPHGRLRNAEQHIEHLLEHTFIQSLLMDRMLEAQLMKGTRKKVFISHSSKDKQFAKWLSVDLANQGHDPWLDEWKIRADLLPNLVRNRTGVWC